MIDYSAIAVAERAIRLTEDKKRREALIEALQILKWVHPGVARMDMKSVRSAMRLITFKEGAIGVWTFRGEPFACTIRAVVGLITAPFNSDLDDDRTPHGQCWANYKKQTQKA